MHTYTSRMLAGGRWRIDQPRRWWYELPAMSAATSTMGSWVRSTKKESRKLKGNLFYNYRKFMFFTIRIVDDRSKATELCVVSFQYAIIPDSQESSSWLSASQAALSAQVERGEMPVEDAQSWQCFSTDLGFSKTVFDSNESNADFRVLCVLNPGSLMGIRIGWSLAENLLQLICHAGALAEMLAISATQALHHFSSYLSQRYTKA